MEPTEQFHRIVVGLLERVVREESLNVKKVAGLLAETLAQDHLIYVFGTGGHSSIGAQEMSSRAGGLAGVYPVLDPGIALVFGPRRSGAIERTPGYAQAALGTYPITSSDVLIIVNAYGINACTIDAALWGKDHAVKTVGLTSPSFSRRIPPEHPARHPSRKNLFEVVDYVVDTKMPERDAVLQFPGLAAWTSPVSTILNAFVIEALVGETVQALLDLGQMPMVWTSANIPGGDEANQAIIRRYAGRIRWL